MLNRPTQNPQTDETSDNQPKVTQKKPQHGIQHQHQQLRVPILIDVPVETLTGITSYLGPPTLFALAAVNKYLNQHVKDDNTWRRAFVYQFLGIGPESDLSEDKTLLLRRSERSWRNEFIVRYRLRRRWERSRNVTTTHIPVHSVISGMHLMPGHGLLTASIEYGIIARSLPLTGKILPGYLDASGTRAGLGIGNPNAEFTPNVSACTMASDGGTAKIVWGSRVGDVLFMTAPRTIESSGRRSAADVRRSDQADEHDGAVLDVKWVDTQSGWVITGGADARVKLWDAKNARSVWTSTPVLVSLVPDHCLKVSSSAVYGTVVAVFRSGDIHVWSGFDFCQSPSFDKVQETVVKNPMRTSTEDYDSEAAHGVVMLEIDNSNNNPTFIVAYENDPFFYRVQVDSVSLKATVTAFGDPYFGSTSIVVPYFRAHASDSSSIAFVGDHLGCISLYSLDATAVVNPRTNAIDPIRKFEAFSDGANITTLTWNGLVLVAGSVRGATQVFDGMTLESLRSFTSPVPRIRGGRGPPGGVVIHQGVQMGPNVNIGPNALEEAAARQRRESEMVRCILLDQEKDVVFIGVGDRVMAWKAGPVPKYNHKRGGVRGRNISGGVKGKKRIPAGRYLGQLEVNQRILESRDILQDEYSSSAASASRSHGNERDQRDGLANLGLSEVEAVEYVLMLSRDEARFRDDADIMTDRDDLEMDEGVFEGDFDEDFDDAASTSDVFGAGSIGGGGVSAPVLSSSASSGSSSVASSRSSITTSPNKPNRSGGIPIARGAAPRLGARASYTSSSSLKSISRSLSNQKVQVSPPTKVEPIEAGTEWKDGDDADVQGTRLGLDDHYFPPILGASSPSITNASPSQSPTGKAKKKEKQREKRKATTTTTASASPKASKAKTSTSPSAWTMPLAKKLSASPSHISSPASSAPRPNAWVGGTASVRMSPPGSFSSSLRNGGAGIGAGQTISASTSGGRGAADASDLDDDLRFAIELSLVEARSRGEDV